jgi:hypothetical protein
MRACQAGGGPPFGGGGAATACGAGAPGGARGGSPPERRIRRGQQSYRPSGALHAAELKAWPRSHLLEQGPHCEGLAVRVHQDGGPLVARAPGAAAAVEEALIVLFGGKGKGK